jgi:hypothetical protein
MHIYLISLAIHTHASRSACAPAATASYLVIDGYDWETTNNTPLNEKLKNRVTVTAR